MDSDHPYSRLSPRGVLEYGIRISDNDVRDEPSEEEERDEGEE